MLMTIGELARRGGVRASTLRYYEEEGLLRPTARVGGQRRYDEGAAEALTVIRFCRELGFSLDEIRTLLSEPRTYRKRTQWRGLVDSKLAELDEAIARAQAMQSILRTSRDCDCVDLEQCAALCTPHVDGGRP
jgi:MerR family redox-sensitive transcriptional activator SoxR